MIFFHLNMYNPSSKGTQIPTTPLEGSSILASSPASLPLPPPLTLPPPVYKQDPILKQLMDAHKDKYTSQSQQMQAKHKRIQTIHPHLIINTTYSPEQLLPIDPSQLSICPTCNNHLLTFELSNHLKLHASLIDPGLYLGASNNATNLKQLQRLNIRSVLNCANELPNTYSTHNTLSYKKLELTDGVGDSVRGILQESLDFVGESLKEGKNVLVHCAQGRSRSATIVIAYLMTAKKMRLREAYDLVKRKRPQISPNPCYLKDLADLEFSLFGSNTLQPQDILPSGRVFSIKQ